MPQSLTSIKDLLAARGLAPKKSLGQNFLVDHNLIRKLVDFSGVQPGEFVLEIGPGTGVLTEELLSRGVRVVACELDNGLHSLLLDRLAPQIAGGQLTLIHGDCLDGKRALNPELRRLLSESLSPREVAEGGRGIVKERVGTPEPSLNVSPGFASPSTSRHPGSSAPSFRLIANLPYGAATPLITNLLLDYPNCSGLFVTVQKEVADRLGAAPDTADYGPLSVIASATAHVERVAKLPPECFWPRPDVTSSMIAIRRRPDPLTPRSHDLADFIQALFEQRRKQLGGILREKFSVREPFAYPPGITPKSRAENLSPQQLLALMHAVEGGNGRTGAVS
ncbi:MAG: 16S rRNA (adenine(1518)-N(6)/adenine(1519)-N(6))-dimethyltransferase [Phycisphaeraceae bacterium]|nr:16S rRNA (adenine(1518)-N(6)/adenine(1519)-N(6))-dimethyltransferase [Phycisphaeraceae bacterium]